MAKSKALNVTLVRSPITFSARQKKTLTALGLRRMNQTVTRPDNPAVRGMIQKVIHLVKVEEAS
ncbi:MAG: 50S ribosomal protein L30 [Chloroflexi bacterium]|nr:50S ribosomal protein L30 [Chloroflexota bacterium]